MIGNHFKKKFQFGPANVVRDLKSSSSHCTLRQTQSVKNLISSARFKKSSSNRCTLRWSNFIRYPQLTINKSRVFSRPSHHYRDIVQNYCDNVQALPENIGLGLQRPCKLFFYFDGGQYFPVKPSPTGYYCINIKQRQK